MTTSDRTARLGFESADGLEILRAIPGAQVLIEPDADLVAALRAAERAAQGAPAPVDDPEKTEGHLG